jgi:hypothetical protein
VDSTRAHTDRFQSRSCLLKVLNNFTNDHTSRRFTIQIFKYISQVKKNSNGRKLITQRYIFHALYNFASFAHKQRGKMQIMLDKTGYHQYHARVNIPSWPLLSENLNGWMNAWIISLNTNLIFVRIPMNGLSRVRKTDHYVCEVCLYCKTSNAWTQECVERNNIKLLCAENPLWS